MELKITYFEKPGKDNTDEVFRIAKQRAEELGIKTIVVASTRGDNAAKAVDYFKGLKVVAVTHVSSFHDPDTQEFTEENRKAVESKGGLIITASHTFGALSRAIRNKYNMSEYGDIIADVLRVFGQGMKVVCECAMMAADAGAVRTDEEVISIAGTGRGADTAVVLTPVPSHHFFDLKVKEILCKPRL